MTNKKMVRRDFLKTLSVGTAATVCGMGAAGRSAELFDPTRQISTIFKPASSMQHTFFTRYGPSRRTVAPVRPNVLLITADDMAYGSVGVNGSTAPNPTPNLDRLAGEGIRFEHAHVNIAVCQPCRGTIATGRYPHRSGIEGFEHTSKKMPTIMQTLKDEGYLTGIFCKVTHSTPHADFVWDHVSGSKKMCNGRSPERFYEDAKKFISRSQSLRKPFYLMANSQDPHRPFAGAKRGEANLGKCHVPPPSRHFSPEEVTVPGFLPDLPEIREEISRYYGSVRRTDDTVGALLQALDDTGERDNTIVIYISDHGMSFPFSKGNCYPQSTRVPWIMRWPQRIEAGLVDSDHFISTIDFMPTILEALELPIPEGLDGRSFVPLLEGKPQAGRELVFTQFYRTSKENVYPMRAVHSKSTCYIFNPWSNGKKRFVVEAMRGLSFEAMRKAAKTDQQLKRRVKYFEYRVLEELYDLEHDPYCLHNLAADRSHRRLLGNMRATLEGWMKTTDDRALTFFRNPKSKRARKKLVNSTHRFRRRV